MKKYLEEGDGGIILLGETGVAGAAKPEEPTEGVVRPGQHALAVAGYLAAVAVLVPRRPNSQFKTRPQRFHAVPNMRLATARQESAVIKVTEDSCAQQTRCKT